MYVTDICRKSKLSQQLDVIAARAAAAAARVKSCIGSLLQ